MSADLAHLEPRGIWNHFAALCAIPRPSKHEERVVAWVRGIARDRGYPVDADAAGNLVVRVPATPGHEAAPIVVLQTHLDMVCEKNAGTEHDFMQDPIRTVVDGEWVRAQGTTLGADNGIGVAAALASATDPTGPHGPLELLFTLDEETGLTGAQQLDPRILHGRTLLNLDSEEDGKIFVGCAGGADCTIELELARATARHASRPFKLSAHGLVGGHSGLEIIDNRGNAIRLVVRTLLAAADRDVDFELASLSGGSKHNAIPREAEAELWLDGQAEASLRQVVASMLEGFRTELGPRDPGVALTLAPGAHETSALARATRDRVLALLAVLPHGVLAMSREIPGLVESSSNLAVVRTDAARLRVTTSSRSSVGSVLVGIVRGIRAAAALAGAQIEAHDGYPGWQPNLASPVLGVVRGVYARIWDKEPEVTAVHAGLECGLLGKRIPGIDMVSFGPEIRGAHSPDERVHVPSVARFWRALQLTLGELA